ncbi:MAG: MASE3 domain-containing protein, partial [Planctomycetota bacterium]
ESLSILLAFLFLKRQVRIQWFFAGHAVVFCLALLSIFAWRVFPTCFDEQAGRMTTFKKSGEWAVVGLLAVSLVILAWKRSFFDRRVAWWIGWSIVATMASELLFTLYAKADDAWNMSGHFLKLISFYLIYKALIETGLKRPFDLLFRELSQSEEALRKARDGLELRVQERTADLAQTVSGLEAEARERLQVEDALRASEVRLAEAQRIAHVGNWDWDIVANELWWSDEIHRIFGLRPQQFGATYEAFLSYVSPDDRAFVEKSVDDALYGGEPYDIDHKIILPDGTERIVHEQAEVTFDADGKPIRMVGTVQDITERKLAETRAQEGRQRLFAVLNMLPGYVALKDENYRVRFANRSYLEIFAPPGQKPCDGTEGEKDESCDSGPVSEVFRSKQPKDWEWTSPGGRSYHAWGYPFSDVDGTALVLEMGIDVTEQRQSDRLISEATEIERRKIGQDLHDTLGQDLTGLAFLIKGLAGKYKEQFPEQQVTAEQVVELVNKSIAKVRSLARGLDPVGLAKEGLMGGLRELADHVAGIFDVWCGFQCDEPVVVKERLVATQLYRIAQEAVNNSIKHAKAKAITITLECRDRTIRLAVEDDGVGISASGADSKGMGMQIMRHRARSIGGSLSVGAGPRGGTVVACTVPLAESALQDGAR